MANQGFKKAFDSVLKEAVNHAGERAFQLRSSWVRALRAMYPNVVFHGDKDIGSATVDGRGVGEWDGVEGCIYNPRSAAPVAGNSQEDAGDGGFVSEDTQPGAVDQAPSDGDLWQKSLEPDTDPAAFNTPDNPNHQISAQNIQAAKGWIHRINEFKRFINGVDPGSLHSQINAMDREGSIFRGIVKSEQKKIIKIAEALASFNEILSSYVIGADKKTRDLQTQTSKA